MNLIASTGALLAGGALLFSMTLPARAVQDSAYIGINNGTGYQTDPTYVAPGVQRSRHSLKSTEISPSESSCNPSLPLIQSPRPTLTRRRFVLARRSGRVSVLAKASEQSPKHNQTQP